MGDGFCIGFFMVFAAFAAFPCTDVVKIKEMNERLGLAPGLSSSINLRAPISTRPRYPGVGAGRYEVSDLNTHLLCRANHTGSDIRITRGQMMSSKNYPLESVASSSHGGPGRTFSIPVGISKNI